MCCLSINVYVFYLLSHTYTFRCTANRNVWHVCEVICRRSPPRANLAGRARLVPTAVKKRHRTGPLWVAPPPGRIRPRSRVHFHILSQSGQTMLFTKVFSSSDLAQTLLWETSAAIPGSLNHIDANMFMCIVWVECNSEILFNEICADIKRLLTGETNYTFCIDFK